MVNIGTHSYVDGPINLYFSEGANLNIGKFCSIAAGLVAILGGNHRGDWLSTFPFGKDFECSTPGHPSSKGDINIGNDVWIGMNSTILSGVTIADGAIIGACSVVSKDIPPYCLVCGNPATVKKQRFDDVTISNLIEIKWWDWPDSKISKAIPYLVSGNIGGLCEFAMRVACSQ